MVFDDFSDYLLAVITCCLCLLQRESRSGLDIHILLESVERIFFAGIQHLGQVNEQEPPLQSLT